jgi:hypothetical protein
MVTNPIELIEWEDHYSTDAWTDADNKELLDTILVTSVGFKLKETRTKIVLAANAATNGQIFGTITILKKTIKSRTILREAP